jgi:Protein of unknown function (DUF1566)
MVAAPKCLRVAVLTLTIGFAIGGINSLGAQSRKDDRGSVQEGALPAYWADPATGLMWPAKDNGKAVTWHAARKYCRNLRLAGYSDWRQPTLDELASLVDKVSSIPERVGNTKLINIGPHVNGNLSLTGDAWSANREINRFGKPYGPGWFFNFTTSKPSYDLQLFRNTKYSLCVRRAEK